MLLVLVVVLSAAEPSRAQNVSLVWAEWETSALARQGPKDADGLLLYFHGRRGTWGDPPNDPLLPILQEMAKIANWDVLRINRHAFADTEQSDNDILQFVAERVAQARQDGYNKIVVGGGSGGGWLALLAATVPGIDAAIGFAPGTAYGRSELIRTRDILSERLLRARATRIAVFFFEGDLLENLEVRRSVAAWRQAAHPLPSSIIHLTFTAIQRWSADGWCVAIGSACYGSFAMPTYLRAKSSALYRQAMPPVPTSAFLPRWVRLNWLWMRMPRSSLRGSLGRR